MFFFENRKALKKFKNNIDVAMDHLINTPFDEGNENMQDD